ncbi:hypothetical protein HY734_02040 [Candidatus Uhrbacteria bacterium]|nr:hypothetical protein [Candidatus Uhrbacteria bacterium]
MKYFIASRWRNREILDPLVARIRAAGHDVYYFVEKTVTKHARDLNPEDYMREYESIKNWREDPYCREIYEQDLAGLKQSDTLLLVLPAGKSAHMEAGIAHGMGKPTILVGSVEETESLYLAFNEWYPSIDEFIASL